METINSLKFRHLKLALCQIVFANLLSIQSRPTSMNKSICGNRPQNSFLWRVEGQPPSYFYGTIHVPYDMVWPDIPQNAKIAFETSDHVYFELDLNDPATMRQLTNCQMLPPGQTLKSIVPPSLYKRIRAHLDYIRRVLPSWLARSPDGIRSFRSGEVSNSLTELGAKSREINDNQAKNMTTNRLETQLDLITYYNYIFEAITGGWQFKRPIWVMLMLNSLTERDIRSREIPVLDLYLSTEADLAGKTTGAVENVRDQCAPLNELKIAQVIAALNYTLVKHELKRTKREDAPILTSNIPTTSTKVQSGNVDSTSFPNANRVIDDHSIEELIDMYNCGDLEKLFTVSKSESSKDSQSSTSFSGPIDKYFRSELIHKRNKNMAERVIDLLSDNLGERSLFFAFGAGHFLGDDTIIDRVRKAGFIVTHLSAHDIIFKHSISYNSPHLENVVDRHHFKRQRLKANFEPAPDVPNNINTAPQFFGYEFPMAPLLIQADVQSLSVASPLSHYSMYKSYGKSPTFKDLWVRDNVPRTFNKPRLRMMTQSKRNIGALRNHKTERNSVNGGNYLPQSNQIKLPLLNVIVIIIIHINYVFILI